MALTKDQIRELILEAPEILDSPGIEFDEDERRAWAKIVNPQRFVMIPDYMLKSWIATLGASRTLVALAFRQVAYISKCKERIGEELAEASIEQLSRWSGLSVGGVHKILSDPGYLTWYVNGIGAKTDEAGNLYADRDRRSYRVRIDIPLTPEDQFKIRAYLEQHAPAEDEDWPLVLYDATKARKSKVPKKAVLPDSPLTIQEIVKDLRGPDRPLTRSIDEACVELYEQWVHPGYFGRATHYFLQRWVPELSSSVACLILWARRRAFLDSHLEEVRFLRLESNQELAQAVGVSDRTIRRIKNDPVYALFLSFSDEEQRTGILQGMENGVIELDGHGYRLSPSAEIEGGLEYGDAVSLTLETHSDGSSAVLSVKSVSAGSSETQKKQAVRLRVRMSDPIHPDDWKRYETLLGLEDRPDLWSKVNVDWTRMNEQWSKVNGSPDRSELSQEAKENRSKANSSRTEMNDEQTEVKSVRTDLKDTGSEVKAFKESSNRDSKDSSTIIIKQPQQEQVVVAHNKGWNIESILRNGAVKKPDRQRILDEWLTRGLEFIAHLLFGLSQETITSPVLFAASRFLNREEPAKDFLELAQMEPISLALELRKNRYREGWGDRQASEQLARADAYEQLARLEAFDLDQEYWDRADFDQVEGDELKRDEYIQLSFVEGDSNHSSTADELWQVVKNQLKDEMPRASYEERLKESGGVSYENDVLTVGVSDEFTRDWLEDRLSATIQRILTGINRRQSEIQFVLIEAH